MCWCSGIGRDGICASSDGANHGVVSRGAAADRCGVGRIVLVVVVLVEAV